MVGRRREEERRKRRQVRGKAGAGARWGRYVGGQAWEEEEEEEVFPHYESGGIEISESSAPKPKA